MPMRCGRLRPYRRAMKQNPVQRLARRRPLIVSMLAPAVMIVTGAVVGGIAQAAGATQGWPSAIGTGAHVVIAGLLLYAIRIWRPMYSGRLPRAWHLLWLPALFALSPWTEGGFAVPAGWTLPALVTEEIGTGVAEEALFRGFMLIVLLHAWGASGRGIRCAVIAQGVIFGVAHLIVGGLDLVVISAVMGILFGAVAIRWGTFWPLVPAHALGNLGYQLLPPDQAASSVAAGLTTVVLLIGTLAVSAWLLRDAAIRGWLPVPDVVSDRLAPTI